VEELHQLFGEARAEVGGRPARDGKDFARAVAGLGVDRGIAGFSRMLFLKRSGKAFLAAPAGRFGVVERSGVDLLREADSWVDRFRRACGANDAPPRLVATTRRLDGAIFEFCKYGGAPAFQQILVALGRAEHALAVSERFREAKKLKPLSGLSSAWIDAADDGSPEFSVARALASMVDPARKIGPLRTNLEAVEVKPTASGKSYATWAEKNRAVVWRATGLPANMVRVLERRLMDGRRHGCDHVPVDSWFPLTLEAVSRFIDEDLDDSKIEAILWGLILVTHPRRRSSGWGGRSSIPRVYALLKLLFHPFPFSVERGEEGHAVARPLRANEGGGVIIRPEPAILPLLRAGRVGEACVLAIRRLRVSGLDPMPRPIRGRGIRDDDWRELDTMGNAAIDPMRLAASLLLPIRMDAVTRLVRLVTRGDDFDDPEAGAATDSELQGGTLS